MKLYTFEQKQFLPITLETAWKFFSDPNQLQNITPPSMNFVVQSALPDKMYAGMIVEYTVTPLLRIPMQWITEITHVHEPVMFVDEQRFGPYRFWHHQHRFLEVPGGIEMHDIISYGLPFGFLGRIAHGIIVRPQLKKIFSYRKKVLHQLFTI